MNLKKAESDLEETDVDDHTIKPVNQDAKGSGHSSVASSIGNLSGRATTNMAEQPAQAAPGAASAVSTVTGLASEPAGTVADVTASNPPRDSYEQSPPDDETNGSGRSNDDDLINALRATVTNGTSDAQPTGGGEAGSATPRPNLSTLLSPTPQPPTPSSTSVETKDPKTITAENLAALDKTQETGEALPKLGLKDAEGRLHSLLGSLKDNPEMDGILAQARASCESTSRDERMPIPAYIADACNDYIKSRTSDANGDTDPSKVNELREKDPQMMALWVAGNQYINAYNRANAVAMTMTEA